VYAFTERNGGTAPDGSAREGVWNEVSFDIVLAPEASSVGTAPEEAR
jgi:hypothetical protein